MKITKIEDWNEAVLERFPHALATFKEWGIHWVHPAYDDKGEISDDIIEASAKKAGVAGRPDATETVLIWCDDVDQATRAAVAMAVGNCMWPLLRGDRTYKAMDLLYYDTFVPADDLLELVQNYPDGVYDKEVDKLRAAYDKAGEVMKVDCAEPETP